MWTMSAFEPFPEPEKPAEDEGNDPIAAAMAQAKAM